MVMIVHARGRGKSSTHVQALVQVDLAVAVGVVVREQRVEVLGCARVPRAGQQLRNLAFVQQPVLVFVELCEGRPYLDVAVQGAKFLHVDGAAVVHIELGKDLVKVVLRARGVLPCIQSRMNCVPNTFQPSSKSSTELLAVVLQGLRRS